MMTKKAKYLGAAILGVLLVGLAVGEVAARTAGWLYGKSLRVASTEGRDGTPGTTLGDGDAYVQDDLEVDGDFDVAGSLKGPAPAVQALAAAFQITADACGGAKVVSATAVVTSSTTTPFTAAASAPNCRMMIYNAADSHEIIIDANTEFPLAGGASGLRLAAGGSVGVYSNGTQWFHDSYTEY